ncbi:uncharacterized protein HaLaN_08421 [Haematococcus lacustris]|uniref:Uncharacterized protein n=1 Tax=Haematococcus lacustris TaxID=44745 RepID=A0A699Z155_HAELA|nr:uncharacterized protein HaLaN_08421 [Haematococcus lacustris]
MPAYLCACLACKLAIRPRREDQAQILGVGNVTTVDAVDRVCDRPHGGYRRKHFAAPRSAGRSRHEGGPGQYLVLVLPRSAGAKAAEGGEVVVGGHRHAWVWTMPGARAGADGVGESDLQQLLEGRVAVAMGRTFAALSDPHTAQALAAQLPTSASGQTLLAFALLNSEGALPLAPPPQPPGPAPRSPGPPVGDAAEGSPEPPAQGPNPDLTMPPLLHWRFADFKHRYLAPLQQALAPLMQLAGTMRSRGVVSASQADREVLSPARVTPRWHAGLRAWVVRSKRWAQYADPDWGVGAGLGARAAPCPCACACPAHGAACTQSCPAAYSAAAAGRQPLPHQQLHHALLGCGPRHAGLSRCHTHGLTGQPQWLGA